MSDFARWRVAALCFALGAGFALGQAPIGLVTATLIAGALQLRVLVAATTVRQSAWAGWCFGAGYFAVTLHWIIEPFLVDIARHGWMAPFALVLMSGGLALFWGAAHGLARWLAVGALPFALVWAVAMTAFEITRAYIFTGFPWALPAYIWSDRMAAQSVAWIGPYGLTLLTLLMSAALYAALLRPREDRSIWDWILIVPVAAAVVMPAPAVRAPDTDAAAAPVVRLIQPNAPQAEKWQADKVQGFFERGLALTQAEGDPDLVIWPETSVPTWLHNADGALSAIANRAGGVPVVVGIQRREDMRFYNSAVVVTSGRVDAVYDKSHLVPFGEYVPFGWVFSKLGIYGLAANEGGGYSAGAGVMTLDVAGIGAVQPLICYEAIFPHLVGATATRPRMLMLITNDAWFGNWAGPRQHLVQAQFRSIEQGLPMVRAANTGISAIIDARGRIVASLELNTAGFVDGALPEATPPTLYAKTGDWPFMLLVFGALIGAAVARRAGRAFAPH